MTIFILSLVIAGIAGGSFIWIKNLYKKNKSLKKINDSFDERIDFYQKNRQAYQAVLDKLIKGKKDADKIKEKINNSDGSDLSDILNEL